MRMRGRLFGLRNFSAQFYGVLNRLSELRCIAEWRSFDISANFAVTIFGLNLGFFSVYNCMSGEGVTCEVTAWLGLWRRTLLTNKQASPCSFNPSVIKGFKLQLLAPEMRDF